MELHLVFSHELLHLVDGSGRGAETIAAVNELHGLGDGLKIVDPIERAVAAA